MKKNDGKLKITFRKVFVMTNIVLFFLIIAKTWENKRRREFRRNVKYGKYNAEQIKSALDDFYNLTVCKDPYIENFYLKHEDFGKLHKLWVLNSSDYWKNKLKKRLAKLEGKPWKKEKNKKVHEYPTSQKLKRLDKFDYKLVNCFGNYCEVRSLEFFLRWGKLTEHKRFGRLAKKLFVWFTNYYAGFFVPTSGSLGRGVEVMPYENITELVKRAKVGQIWPCSCKSFRPTDEGIPRATCMLIAEVASLDDTMTKYPDMGSMCADEVLAKLKEFEDVGLTHQIMCVSSPQGRKMYVLCNCDNKACVPMFLKVRYGIPMVKASGFVCTCVNPEKCVDCRICMKRCQLAAIKIENGAPVIDAEKCLGCGLCVTTCKQRVLKMERRATESIHEYTQNQIKNHPEKTMRTE